MKIHSLLSFSFLVFLSTCGKNIPIPEVNNNTDGFICIEDQYITNNCFEEYINFSENQGDWSIMGGGKPDPGEAAFVIGKGFGYSNCIKLSSTEPCDIAVSQSIEGLDPGVLYTLHGKIKTENITGSGGANICLINTWIRSKNLQGTNGWTDVSFDFFAPDDGKIIVGCRLGYWAAESKGIAWFDNLRLIEADFFHTESEHISIYIRNDVFNITEKEMDQWLFRLDRVYESYVDLFNGKRPFKGEKLIIKSAKDIPAWAWAGSIIEWNEAYIPDALWQIVNEGDWCFGIIHEMAHNFAPNGGFDFDHRWIWDEEVMANFRLCYALERTEGKIIFGGHTYMGKDIIKLYRDFYNQTIGEGIPANGDAILYTLLRITQEFGWEVVKSVFADHYTNTYKDISGSTPWKKFDYFLSQLSLKAGVDVRETYTIEELNNIRSSLSAN